jgi:hypothetical protein
MNFKDFKKNAKSLSDTVTKMSAKTSYKDERFWTIAKDAAGNGNATFRFLPQKDLEKSPIVLTFRHGFQSAGRWFIEDCPVTIKEKCPICEHSSSIWSSNEKEARKYWRKKSYIANILMVDDPANPENNGKVFLFKFGKSIYDIIMETVAPEDDDEQGVNIFDFDEGLNFKLKLVQKGEYNNYDKSKFLNTPCEVADGDEDAQEKIYNSIIPFDEFTAKDKFKSYNELVNKFSKFVQGYKSPIEASIEEAVEAEVSKPETIPSTKPKKSAPVEDTEESNEDDEFDFDALLADD